MSNNLHEGHRKRVKEDFLHNGCSFASKQPHKMLELILFYSVPRKDTNVIAHRLIERFGSLPNVFSADIEQLIAVEGVTEATAVLLKLFLVVNREYMSDLQKERRIFNSPDAIGEYLMCQFFGIKEEMFSLITLDGSGGIIDYDILTKGALTSVGLNSRKVLEIVIKRQAVSVIIAHNHPGSLALPSGEDITSTKALSSLLKNVGINLIDHFIICDDDYVSLAQSKDFKDIFI